MLDERHSSNWLAWRQAGRIEQTLLSICNAVIQVCRAVQRPKQILGSPLNPRQTAPSFRYLHVPGYDSDT